MHKGRYVIMKTGKFGGEAYDGMVVRCSRCGLKTSISFKETDMLLQNGETEMFVETGGRIYCRHCFNGMFTPKVIFFEN